MKDNPTPPEKGASLEQLVELMTANNASTTEIERDGRNTRRHLLEMKKIQQASLDMSDSVNTGFENFFEVMNANKLGDQEDSKERSSIFEEIRDELKEMRSSGIPNSSGSSGSSAGGTMGGIGKMLGGAGLGVGAAAVGVAAVFASSAFLIKTIENMDGKKIVANVKDLLAIADLEADEYAAAQVFGTLAAIGVGLVAFGVGAFFAKAASDDTAKEVKAAVATYLSIAQIPGEEGDAARVGGTLGVLGLGLLAFGVGEFFSKATSTENAASVKASVSTLLSIGQDPNIGSGKAVKDDLIDLGKGLAAFGVGSFFAKGSHEGQGEAIRGTVGHLLSIAEDPNATGEGVKTAVGTLAALGAGLAAFGIGSFFAGTGDAVMSGESVKNEVASLLDIGGLGNLDQMDATVATLASLGAGLAAFGAGQFIGALGAGASAIVGFFSGGDSPIEAALKVGERSADIDKGTEAFGRFADVLERFGSIGSVDFNAQKFAEELTMATKAMEYAIVGGTDDNGIFGSKIEYVGLKNMESDIDAAVASITKLQGSLNMSAGGNDVAADKQSVGVELMTVSAQNVELRSAANQSGGSTVNAVSSDNSSTRGGDTYNIVPQKPNRSREALASR
jgi:hypothetical protein